MTPERWETVKGLLAEALERTPNERAVFLAKACGGDTALQAEVESLLRAEEHAIGFLEPPEAVTAAPATDLIGKLQVAVADRYTIERELAHGGMGTVYLVRDLRHDRPVALKVLDPELAHSLGHERFLREIRTTARLQHPHILPIHDSGVAAEQLWYTMPYVEGDSLRERLRRERQLPVDEALRITREVADALEYAHRQGIVHRDIKPENILLSQSHALVADFGIARAIGHAADERLTGTGISLGTPAYMSPEQAVGSRELDGRSDQYSLSCVLYEMLAGEPPFTGPSPQAIIARRITDPPPRLSLLRSAVSPAVEEAVTKALAREPADRFRSADEFARALSATTPVREGPAPAARTAQKSRPRRRFVLLGLTMLLGLGAASAALLWRSHAAPATLDGNLVAVAPFDVLDPSLQLWREGLVDVLARDLDGAGPLRTVSPTVIVRRWRGRADPSSAATLGRRTGARLAVYGTVLRSGTDSVRIAASMFDAARERSLGELEVRGALANMDRLVDSLAVGLLRELGRTQAVGVVRHTGLGARSLPALKAFLQAEQYYRQGRWDSAQAYAEQAVALDTTFALAYKRLAQAIGWQPIGVDGQPFSLRAGALNHGLTPRDSLLVLAESLNATVMENGFGQPANPALAARLQATVEQAAQQYPEDPEAWHALGEMRHHLGGWLLRTGGWRATLDAFERSIALDPLFGPAYIHPVEASFGLGDTASGRRFAETVIRLNPQSAQSRGLEALYRLLNVSDSAGRMRLLDTLSEDALWEADEPLARWPDSAELGVLLLRGRARSPKPGTDTVSARLDLAQALAFRGHLREALALTDTLSYPIFAQAALLGYVPAERARATFAAWLGKPPLRRSVASLPWWSGRRETAPILRFIHLADSAIRAQTSLADSAWFAPMVTLGRAHLALARRDTSAALRIYDSLIDAPDVAPWWCQDDRLLAARILAGRRQLDQAARILNAPPTIEGEILPRPSDILWYLERGRVAEQLGDRARALEAYRYVSAAWRRADPELDPYAAEARDGLARLAAEPGR